MNKLKYGLAALLIFSAISSVCFAGCSRTDGGPAQKEEEEPEEELLPAIQVSKLAGTPQGKVYLEVDGKPFPLFGAQIRIDVFKNCDNLSDSQIEDYFKKAKALNLNCVQLPLPWKAMEPDKGKYDYGLIDTLLGLANKYDLKVELLWFGTNFIGDSYSYFIPSYALKEQSCRLKRKGKMDADYKHNLYGYCYSLIFNDKALLEREVNAIRRLFNHIRVWDSKNGERHPVISCQLNNEVDGMVRWRITDASLDIRYQGGDKVGEEDCWKMTLDAVDAIGKAVKSSTYKVVTRVNYTSCANVGVFPQCSKASPVDALEREGIDFISVDPYMDNVNSIAGVVESFATPKGNYPLIAENRGYYPATPSLILATAALGGGYDIYDLATSKFIYDNNGFPWSEEGIYTYDLKDRSHTALARSILKGLTAAGEDVALTPKEDFVAFNINKNTPDKGRTQIVSTTGARFTIESKTGAIGFILDRGDRLVMYFTGAVSVVVENGTLEGGAKRLTLEAEQLLETGFESKGKIKSTTADCIGS